MNSGINFSGYESDYANNKQSNFRKAGDAFKTASNREPSKDSAYSKWMSFMGNQSNSVGSSSNTSTNLNNSQPSSETSAAAPKASQPAVSQPTASQPSGPGEIDYARWAADSVANDPTSAAAGADAAYWEKTYRKNNSEYEQNKALMASHQGPKTYDDLKSNAQSRSGTGNGATRNTESIADYEAYTKYATAKQGVEAWEKASAKYRS